MKDSEGREGRVRSVLGRAELTLTEMRKRAVGSRAPGRGRGSGAGVGCQHIPVGSVLKATRSG